MKNVRKFLDMSTAHIPAETAQALEDGTLAKKAAFTNEYGFFLYIPTDPFDAESIGCAHLYGLLCLAQDAGCDYLMLDRDADPVEYLPVFDW